MKEIRRVLLWEIIRYAPKIFFILEPTCQKLQEQLSSDASYIQYFIEETWNEQEIRALNFSSCRNVLSKILQSDFLYFLHNNEKSVSRFNLHSKQHEKFQFDEMTQGFSRALWNILGIDTLFVCWRDQTHKLTFSTRSVTNLAPMINGRVQATSARYGSSIYVFGGGLTEVNPIRICEQYDILNNQWTELPELPHDVVFGTTEIFQNRIYITARDCPGMIQFSPQDKTFQQICFQNGPRDSQFKKLFTFGTFLCIQSFNEIFELDKNLVIQKKTVIRCQGEPSRLHFAGSYVIKNKIVYFVDGRWNIMCFDLGGSKYIWQQKVMGIKRINQKPNQLKMDSLGFTTKRGIVFNDISNTDFHSFITDLQQSITLNKQAIFKTLEALYGKNQYISTMEQLLYENQLIEININEVIRSRRFWQTKALLSSQILLEKTQQMADSKQYFEENIEEIEQKDEQRDKALDKNTAIYYDLLDQIDFGKKCQYVIFVAPSNQVFAFHEGTRKYYKKVQRCMRRQILFEIHNNMLSSFQNQIEKVKKKLVPLEKEKNPKGKNKKRRSSSLSFDCSLQSVESKGDDQGDSPIPVKFNFKSDNKADVPALDMSGIIESRPAQTAPPQAEDNSPQAQLELEIQQIEDFLDDLQIEFEDIRQQLQEETQIVVERAEENRILVNILQN